MDQMNTHTVLSAIDTCMRPLRTSETVVPEQYLIAFNQLRQLEIALGIRESDRTLQERVQAVKMFAEFEVERCLKEPVPRSNPQTWQQALCDRQQALEKLSLLHKVLTCETIIFTTGPMQPNLGLGRHTGLKAFVETTKRLGFALNAAQLNFAWRQFKTLCDSHNEPSNLDVVKLCCETLQN